MAAAEPTSARTGSPVPSAVPTSPLVERIRRGIIGEGELMDGPFGPRRVEHHSNELPWRESIAEVVVIGEDADGDIDLRTARACRPRHLAGAGMGR